MYYCPIKCKFEFSKTALITSLSFKGVFYFLQIPKKFKSYWIYRFICAQHFSKSFTYSTDSSFTSLVTEVSI